VYQAASCGCTGWLHKVGRWPTLSRPLDWGAPSFRSLIAKGWDSALQEFQIGPAQAPWIKWATNPRDPFAHNYPPLAHNRKCGEKKSATGDTTRDPSHPTFHRREPGSSLLSLPQKTRRRPRNRAEGVQNPDPDRASPVAGPPPLPHFYRNPGKRKGLVRKNPIRPAKTKNLPPWPASPKGKFRGTLVAKQEGANRCLFRSAWAR
jgi:hypothetical protein